MMLLKADFGDLACLWDIYQAAHHKHKQGGDLPLFVHGASVCYRGSMTGRLKEAWMSAFHPAAAPLDTTLKNILDVFFLHAVRRVYDGRQRRIWHHMRQIEQLWGKPPTPQDNLDQCDRYDGFLNGELKGSIEKLNVYLQDFRRRSAHPYPEGEISDHRRVVIAFHEAAFNFWSLFVKNQEVEIRDILLPYVGPETRLTDRPLYKALKKEGRWVNLEGLLQQPIPVALLSKLSDPDSLTFEQKKNLRDWVQKLNQLRQVISLKTFSVLLKEVLEIIQLQGSSPLTMPELLLWLDKEGCLLLRKPDPVHLQWRESLHPGSQIDCNGKPLILGEQLSPHKGTDDEYKIFALANPEFADYVVMIANNRFRLPLRQKKGEDEQWGVRLVETIQNLESDPLLPVVAGLDREGRCAVVERLSAPISSHVWTSTAPMLTEGDERVALVLASHLFCMQDWNGWAKGLSLSHLMWDKNGVLKSTRLLSKGAANYNVWEAFCVEVAKGNPFVLSFLMRVSKLSEHKIAVYYREAVEYALKKGETDLLSRPLPLGYRESIYDQKADEICTKALELRQASSDVDKLLDRYRKSPTPGIVSTRLLENTVSERLSKTTTVETVFDPADSSAYYQEKHKLMLSYNETVIKG